VTPRRAIIVGAGIAGLSAGIALRQAGWAVEIYEQAPALVPMGAALSLWPNAMAALDQLGCGDAIRAIAQPLMAPILADSKGRLIAELNVGRVLPDSEAFLPRRSELQSALLAGFGHGRLQLGHTLAGCSQDANTVSVSFENGAQAAGDLLVAADGIWSNVAKDLLGVEARHTGYGGVLALSGPVPSCPSAGRGGEYWGVGERFGVFDLKAGRKYWFFMRNEQDAFQTQALTLAVIRARAAAFPAAVRTAIDATDAVALIPFSIHAKPSPNTLGKGRFICVGDAAHAMEPNLGQGGCQAIEDAVALGVATRSTDTLEILPCLEAMRLKRIRQFVTLSTQGAMIPHRLPNPLAEIGRSVLRAAFPLLGPRQMRGLYRLPDYAGMG
jgi:2-polyprenyl-6-methoxyphenol hydroxylase-like FAD-dependent oxidoreductase